MNRTEKTDLFVRLLKERVTAEDALQALVAGGESPSLVHDEKSKGWAVLTAGVKATEPDNSTYDIAFYVFGNLANFRASIRNAVLAYLWPKEEYEDDDVYVRSDGTYFFKRS
jgi:hypothetical protein